MGLHWISYNSEDLIDASFLSHMIDLDESLVAEAPAMIYSQGLAECCDNESGQIRRGSAAENVRDGDLGAVDLSSSIRPSSLQKYPEVQLGGETIAVGAADGSIQRPLEYCSRVRMQIAVDLNIGHLLEENSVNNVGIWKAEHLRT